MRELIRNMTAGRRRCWLAAWLLILVPRHLPGQSAAAGDEPTFAEILDVRVINLEAVVTSGGRRVSGLAAADFELRVDGREVPIEYFTEVRAGRAEAAPSAESALAPGEPVATRYLVFIDDFFAVPSHRNRVLRALRKQLPRLAPADRMALVAYDGRRIDLLSPWTRSETQLAAAIDQAMERTAYGLRRLSEQRRLSSPGGRIGFSPRTSFSSISFWGSGRDAMGVDLEGGDETTGQISQTVRAAASALRGYASGAGRKVMLLLSGGWPAFSLERTDRLVGGTRPVAPGERFAVFDVLVETASRLGYTLYPVDLQSYAEAGLRDAEHGSLAAARSAAAGRGLRVSDARDALVYLAEATGGRAFEGAASLRALEGTVEDTRSYYWLSFTPRWRGDDRSRRLQIKVRRKGTGVRCRTSLADLTRSSDVSLMVEGAQLFDSPLPGEGEIDVELGAPRRTARGRVRVPLRLEIPLAKLTLLPAAGGYTTALELRVAARDEDGAMAEIPVLELAIERGGSPAAGDVEIYETELKLRHKPHRLIVALYEPTTGNLLSQRLELEL